VEELDACFVVTDSAGRKLAYIYFEDEPGGRKASQQRRGTKDCGEHRQVAGASAQAMNSFERPWPKSPIYWPKLSSLGRSFRNISGGRFS